MTFTAQQIRLPEDDTSASDLRLEWRDGPPPKPWSEEWFIAHTTYGDRVVLRALPEEFSYDFRTADDTYIKADKIKRWMQFPDSSFIAPATPAAYELVPELLAACKALLERYRIMVALDGPEAMEAARVIAKAEGR